LQIRKPFPISDPKLAARLVRPQFPLSNRYDPWWIAENQMGPHPIWLTESLLGVAPLPSTARVLDLGCGKALTSMFVAIETGTQVWATDLWIPAADNLRRIEAAELTERVFPIHSEAHWLHFAKGYFDAIFSIDAYHYFGTDEVYLAYLSKFLRPGGLLGIVMPGLTAELDLIPEHLESWFPRSAGFHSPEWWRRHLSASGLVTIDCADLIPDGWRLWADWCRICSDLPLEPIFPGSKEHTVKERDAIELDAGRTMGFVRIVAHKA